MILNKKKGKKISDNLITYSNPDSVISDQFRTIRTNLKFLPGERQHRIFLISSAGEGEGKSIVSANLAVSLAQQKEKILLIDANLRNPVIDQIFEIPNEVGLADVLTKKQTFNEVVNKTGIGDLDILTSGSTLFNPAELISNEVMTTLLHAVVSAYHIVLIDTPSVLEATETRVLANQCDGVILVVNRGRTTVGKIAEARKVLELTHATLAGAIVNEK